MPSPDDQPLPLPGDGPAVILCDFAEVINGKLYLMGAGWSRVAANNPINVGVAIFWRIPWSDANRQQSIEVAFVTEDGEPFLSPEGEPVGLRGDAEVGRPAGVKPGSLLDAPIAFNIGGMVFPEGGYRCEFRLQGQLRAAASFVAVGSVK